MPPLFEWADESIDWAKWYAEVAQPTMRAPEIRNTPLFERPSQSGVGYLCGGKGGLIRRVDQTHTPVFLLGDKRWTRDPEPEERSLWQFLSPAADPTGSDVTRRLPQELLCYIFSFLELRDLLPIAPVCSRWRETVDYLLRRQHTVTMRQLSLKRGSYVTQRSLCRMVPRLTHLRVLRVTGPRLRSLKVDIVGFHCRLLETIDLTSFRVSKASMVRLCTRCPRLSDLTLPPDGEEHLAEVAACHLRGLRSLKLVRTTVLDGSWLAALPPSLTTLSLVECHVEGATALAESNLPDLRRLNLSGEMYIDWVAVELALSRWPGLERLDLAESSVPAELVRELPDLVPGLIYLDLSGCNVTPWSVASLHRLKNLRHLKLTDVRLINIQWSAVVRDATELVESLQRITSLRELSLGETPRRRGPLQMSFNAAAVEWLVTALPALERLNVAGCCAMCDWALLEDLRSLRLSLSPKRKVTIQLWGSMEKTVVVSGRPQK